MNKMKSIVSPRPQSAIAAHDTLQALSYEKRLAFNALWEPKETGSINVKAIERRNILGDKYLESIIKIRPRSYMAPSVSLDDIQDRDKRRLLIDFIYRTTANQAAKEVWSNFEPQGACLLKKHEEESLINQRVISRLPARFQATARKWDNVQHRSFLVNGTCHDKRDEKASQPQNHADKKRSMEENSIKKLINEDKLSIIYDKLPSSYKGYRPHTAYGVPFEKREM